jgi:hypothetical protein
VDDVIDSIESSLAPGYQERYRAGSSEEVKSEMRRALHMLSKLKFD